VSYLNHQEGYTERSESTAAYCKARQRLPLMVARGALRWSAQSLQNEWGESGLWHGYPVCLLDGSTLRLPATEELREQYGIPTNQHGASHWPTMRLVAGFDLFSGAAWEVIEGSYSSGEHALACELILSMPPGFVYMGDRNFGVYHLAQVITYAHCQAVLRLCKRQAGVWGQANLQHGSDTDIVWSPTKRGTCEPNIPAPDVPGRLIAVRIPKRGFRPIQLYLFTTLTDRKAFSVRDLVDLYGLRWQVELDLRHVKTTLNMQSLSAKSVDVVCKELYLGLLAYNLIRGLMGMAAQKAGLLPMQLSLASCWRRIQDVCLTLSPTASTKHIRQILQRLLKRLARCLLPKRNYERHEPREVWGKPQIYPRIKGSRAQAREKTLEILKSKCW